MEKVVGKIVAKAKDESEVVLCSRCQFELEGESTCSNCGAEIFEFDRDTLSLVPADEAYYSQDKNESNQFSGTRAGVSEPNPPSHIKIKSTAKKKVSVKLVTFIMLGLLGGLGLLFKSSLTTMALTPIVDNAIEDAHFFQSAINGYHNRQKRWPQTTAQLKNLQYFRDSQFTYFVLMPNGSFQQVFKSPFFLKDKSITWQRNNKGWTCSSKFLNEFALVNRCEG